MTTERKEYEKGMGLCAECRCTRPLTALDEQKVLVADDEEQVATRTLTWVACKDREGCARMKELTKG